MPFALAHPGLTHMAIQALADYGGFEKFLVVSQNVDGLHRRSGLDPSHLIELHGNCFMEECFKCHHKVSRDFEVEYVGFRYTGERLAIGEFALPLGGFRAGRGVNFSPLPNVLMDARSKMPALQGETDRCSPGLERRP